MSEKAQFVLLAQYNALMNRRLLAAAGRLSDASLGADRGAFFKSVIGTLNHIMVGDLLWLNRFATHPNAYPALAPLAEIAKPTQLDEILHADLDAFEQSRYALDDLIIRWCDQLQARDLDDPLRYTNYKGESHVKRLGDLILHMFLHQVHHRGQATTLLSQAGVDFGDTDLPEILPELENV
ncbi:MAG: DinB family protein [Thiohalobacteraceae bacterium]